MNPLLLFIPILALAFVILYLTRPQEIEQEPIEESSGDEELGWFDWEEEHTCEICDEVIYEGEALVYIRTENEYTLCCEYCLNSTL